MDEQQQALATFVASAGITAEAKERAPTEREREEWSTSGGTTWTVTLRRSGTDITMKVPFGMGSAHTAPPTVEQVLDCVASDSAGYENARTFEEWAGEYGYDTDSRRAERTYRQVKKQAVKLCWFLGEVLYKDLLWETERL